MSHNKQDEGWFIALANTVIAYAFIGIAFFLTGVILALFALAKRPIAKAWGLELGIPVHRDRRFRSIVTGHSGAS